MFESFSGFAYHKFAEYYTQHSSSVKPPTSIEKREFGFLLFKERIMLRHKGFRSVGALRSSLKTIAPSDVYYSSSYYERPEEEMKEKGWLGADLIFDIDADHIPTPCAKVHDTWACSNCGALGRGSSLKKCPACGGRKLSERTWPCEVCLGSAKTEAIKLMDILTKDFGFSPQELKVGFSGHRGYHVQVESEEIRGLSSMARKEIVDYVLGIGLETEFHGLGYRGGEDSRMLPGPDLYDFGWSGRIARGTYDLLLAGTREELEEVGLKKRVVDTIIQYKEKLLESWNEKGPWGIISGIGKENWRKIAQYGVEKQSAKIDTVVTTDTHRLIRLTNTLHGKTGLKKTEVPVTGIENFDPLKSAVAFDGGTVTVLVSDAPRFRLGDEIYGPYKEQKIEVSTAAALMLLCKGVAKVVESVVR